MRRCYYYYGPHLIEDLTKAQEGQWIGCGIDLGCFVLFVVCLLELGFKDKGVFFLVQIINVFNCITLIWD